MAMPWQGSELRHMLAVTELQAAGLSIKAADLLVQAGVFTVKDFLEKPWSDEEADSRFASVQWRMSVLPHCTPKLIAQVDAARLRLLGERKAA